MADPQTPGASGPQRRWQAPCPNCGAAVEFQSAAASCAVCSYCRSTVVRDGDSLRKIGISAELINDHSPLQLGASGVYQQRSFTLVGRLQHGYGAEIARAAPGETPKIEGSWNEWYVLFADGKGGWLSEDNDQYVFAQDVAPETPLPAAASLALEDKVFLFDKAWRVASLVQSRLLAAQGELPHPPPLNQIYTIADLRNTDGLVATLDYAQADQPQLAIGRPVRLNDLRMQGLKLEFNSETKAVKGRSFDCPNCGSAIEIKLAQTRSLTCASCHALIDVSAGIGAELNAVKQQQYMRPKLPIGQVGRLSIAGLPSLEWQIIGFSHKRARASAMEDSFTWSDYLLYNRNEGFAFLIDSSDGWVGYRTLTGVPKTVAEGRIVVEWNNQRYRQKEAYSAEVVYVEGEFYWQVDRRQRLDVVDYTGGKPGATLSRESTETEVIWSYGERIPANFIISGFALGPEARKRIAPDVGPVSDNSRLISQSMMILLLILIFVLLWYAAAHDDGYDSYYGSHGGSWGGYSSGGGHK